MIDSTLELDDDARREKAVDRSLKRAQRNVGRNSPHRGRSTFCYRCRRPIVADDPKRTETFYDSIGSFEASTHALSCATYRDRPQLKASELKVEIIERGLTRTATMSKNAESTQDETETTETPKAKTKKSKTKKEKRSKSEAPAAPSAEKTKKSKKEKGSKKAKSAPKAERVGSAAASLAAALKGVKFNSKKVASTIKELESDEVPSNSKLVALRDHLKAEASRLREEGDGTAASELSNINRAVRRLERSTR